MGSIGRCGTALGDLGLWEGFEESHSLGFFRFCVEAYSVQVVSCDTCLHLDITIVSASTLSRGIGV